MAIANALTNQLENKNFLSPIGFKFTLNRVNQVAFFGNEINIPAISAFLTFL